MKTAHAALCPTSDRLLQLAERRLRDISREHPVPATPPAHVLTELADIERPDRPLADLLDLDSLHLDQF